MSLYITRKIEVYHRARQSLARVQQYYGKSKNLGGSYQGWQSNTWHNSSWSSWSRNQWHGSGTSDHGSQARWDEPADTPQEDDDDQWYDPPSEAPEAASWHASSYGYGYHEGTDDEPWKLHAEELLPEFLQGWYLLADSGLDSLERNMVQTALQEDFSVQRVAKELRLQWPDEELKRRDQQTKNAGFWANEPDQELDLEDGPDVGLWMDDLTGQGHALFQAAEEQAQEAYAAIQQARRTLKEARSRQHQVKLSRQYYKTTFQRPHRPYPPRSDGMTCLKCGKGHRTNECPEKQNSDGKHQSHVTEEAPFVCYSEEAALATNGIDQCRTTYEAVQAGCAVIDGGATKTLGSVEAIQAVMDQNIAKHGSSRIQEVDVTNQPQFGFGNGSKDRCISTTQLQVTANDKPGTLQIHALDRGSGPILLSIQTLRALKAVIDFDEDLLVLRGLDATKIIPLERSAAGHQLLPLTEDLFKTAHTCKSQVPSLREYIH